MPVPLAQPLDPAEAGASRRLLLALVASLLIHAAAVLALARPGLFDWANVTRPSDLADANAPTTQRLGLETSNAVSINWIGFVEADPDPVARDRARFEQPELTRLPQAPPSDDEPLSQPGPPKPNQPAPPPPAAQVPSPPAESAPQTPAPAEEASESAAPPQQPRPADAPPAEAPPAQSPIAEGPDPVLLPSPPELEPVPEPQLQPQPAEDEPAPAAAASNATTTSTTAPTPPVAPAQVPTAAEPGRAGTQRRAEPSDRDASAVARTFDVNPWRQTKPLAGEGIEIRTVAPREIPIAERTLLRQTRVVLDIRFGPDGVVKFADFAELKDDLDRPVRTRTGNPYIDGPIKDAVYRWRASGPAVRAIPAGQTMTVRMRINIS